MAKYFLLGILAILLTSPAHAMKCTDREGLLDLLWRQHSEAITGRGLAGGGAMIELYTTGNGETWTLVAPPPNDSGVSCVITDGKGWQSIPFKPMGEKL